MTGKNLIMLPNGFANGAPNQLSTTIFQQISAFKKAKKRDEN